MARCNEFAASILVCCLLAHHASWLENAQAVVLQYQFLVARRVILRQVVIPRDACFHLPTVEDDGCEASAAPAEAQPMLLFIVVGLFSDAAVDKDCPDDTMFLTARLSRALVLVALSILPLGIWGVIASLRSRE